MKTIRENYWNKRDFHSIRLPKQGVTCFRKRIKEQYFKKYSSIWTADKMEYVVKELEQKQNTQTTQKDVPH